jgi:hypothetical protein
VYDISTLRVLTGKKYVANERKFKYIITYECGITVDSKENVITKLPVGSERGL